MRHEETVLGPVAAKLPRLNSNGAKDDGRPLSLVARQEILAAIVEGRFANNRLPPESVLADQMGVSRTTIRSALQVLERDGLITRRRGAGTFIKPSSLPFGLGLHRLVSFSALLAERGYEPQVNLEMARTHRLKRDWMERLGIKRPEECLILNKVFIAEESPALAITDVIPISFLSQVPKASDDVPDGIFSFFQMYGSRSIDRATVEIIPMAATSAIATQLGMRRGDPYLHLIELHYSSEDLPLALSYIDVNDRYIRFDVTRQHG